MTTKLLEIEPSELKFTFESKKQSSCAIHLANISDQYVAFKVKTTSPKKYCVRPNIGIVKPKSTCDFTVTMQAQHSAPSDMQCKDKFLIQGTIVPFGTSEEDVTTGMFTKESGKYVEESKLRVILVSPPHSPVLLPINGVLKQEPSHETSMQKEKLLSGVENLPPTEMATRDAEDFKIATDMDELRPTKDMELRPTKVIEEPELRAVKDMEPIHAKNVEPRPVEDAEGTKLNLINDIEELKLKVNGLNSKLIEAQFTITKLKEEKSTTIQENESLKQELAIMLRRKPVGVRRVEVGFPLLFVCMVALISLTVGYVLHR
ncbi:vesicle-associated protein 2-2-like [Cornus florida]|uniref:vesicle-associated protein 2-2-like n=1 Tax=Cornus florida TaxID=4283 RepID=UPI0028969066|nr:vesicle-associated protein 2-2-like [Cornus florida]